MSDGSQRHSYSALRNMGHGFAFVILGLTAGLFLYAAQVRGWSAGIWLSFHVFSVVMLGVGGWWWWRMPPLSANWLRISEQFCIAVLLQVYMIPFAMWWRAAPRELFFGANVLLAFAALAWLLPLLGAMVVETGKITRDRLLVIVGRAAVWLSPLLVLVPLAVALVNAGALHEYTGRTGLLGALRISTLWPRGSGTALLFAPVLVLAVCIEARLRCLRAAKWLRASHGAGISS